MMRLMRTMAIFLAGLVSFHGTASATVFDIAILAQVSGTDTRDNCGAGQTFPFCPVETLPYDATLSRSLGPMDLLQGDNTFSYGSPYSTGLISGVINNDNGVLTGRNLSYTYASCSGPCPGDHIYATAQSFTVFGGVPEPETWVTLLVGIGAVAWTMRRRQGAAAGNFRAVHGNMA